MDNQTEQPLRTFSLVEMWGYVNGGGDTEVNLAIQEQIPSDPLLAEALLEMEQDKGEEWGLSSSTAFQSNFMAGVYTASNKAPTNKSSLRLWQLVASVLLLACLYLFFSDGSRTEFEPHIYAASRSADDFELVKARQAYQEKNYAQTAVLYSNANSLEAMKEEDQLMYGTALVLSGEKEMAIDWLVGMLGNEALGLYKEETKEALRAALTE